MSVTPQEFFDKCSKHDWLFDYSDDSHLWEKGNKQRLELLALASGNQELNLIYLAWYDFKIENNGAHPKRPES